MFSPETKKITFDMKSFVVRSSLNGGSVEVPVKVNIFRFFSLKKGATARAAQCSINFKYKNISLLLE